MNVTQPAAGGSRNVEATRAFLPLPVILATPSESTPAPSTSTYAWKRVLQERIWSANGPKGITARGILMLLLWHADAHGRAWLSISTLATKGGLGSLRTVRNALDKLVQAGWLRVTAQTWASLTTEQKAAGRPVPRRGDAGQAPHLCTILDGQGRAVTTIFQGGAAMGPGLARVEAPSGEPSDETPSQTCQGGPGQNGQGEPLTKVTPDLDPAETVSKEVSEGGATRAQSTHDFSKAQEGKGGWGWLESWQLVVQAHAAKTKSAYGLAPMAPDVKRPDRKAMAECLDGAGAEVAAKFRARGMERELVDVRRELAERAIALYFRNDTAHLRKTKHALRDLPREFHARITEAMQTILRESHDGANVPRRTAPLEQPAQGTKAETAEQMTKSDAAEKPLPESMPANTAREARRLMAVLNGTSSREEPSKSSKAEHAPPSQPWLVAAQEPAQDLPNASQAVRHSMGRPGAPRWGALAPTPTKIRRVLRLQLPELEESTEGPEPHPRE